MVQTIAGRLSGGAGLSGTDATTLQMLLVGRGGASRILREAVGEFTEWTMNHNVPWPAIRAFASGRLMALDKMPGIRPIGIGELWRRLFCKLCMLASGEEATEACGNTNLCGGLEAGIEGGIHAAKRIWDELNEEEEWGFTLVDARNAFNEENRTAMLWTVRHLWPSGAQFAFNFYKHFAILVIRGKDSRSACIILSKEGVTQGCPLAMVLYAIGLLPLTKKLKRDLPDLFQPWYADDGAAGGKWDDILRWYEALADLGPPRGYFPEPSKSILIVHPSQVDKARLKFQSLGLKVKTGHRYLGGFIGDSDSEARHISSQVLAWTEAVKQLATVAADYPQAAYSGMQRSLQQEWQFMQRVSSLATNDPNTYSPLENAIRNTFVKELLQAPTFWASDENRELTKGLSKLPIRTGGLALPDPTETLTPSSSTSRKGTSHLTDSLLKLTDWDIDSHKETMKEAKSDYKSEKLKKAESEYKTLTSSTPPALERTISRGKQTGAWLSTIPSQVNGTCLSRDEWRDMACIRYGIRPESLPPKCDGCGKEATVEHLMSCSYGGLTVGAHDEIKNELAELCAKALRPSCVRDEPLIIPISRNSNNNAPSSPSAQAQPSSTNTTDTPNTPNPTSPTPPPNTHPNSTNTSPPNNNRGDISIRGFWEHGTDCIVDVRIINADCKTHASRPNASILKYSEQAKKRKHLQACLTHRRHFTPFVCTRDGLLGDEAEAFLKRLARHLSKKWDKPYSRICGWLRSRLSITMARATHRCLRWARTRITANDDSFKHLPSWEDGAGLNLARW